MSRTAFLLPLSHQLSLIFFNFSFMFLNPNNFFRSMAGVLSIQAYYYDKNSFKVAFCHVQNAGLDSKKIPFVYCPFYFYVCWFPPVTANCVQCIQDC